MKKGIAKMNHNRNATDNREPSNEGNVFLLYKEYTLSFSILKKKIRNNGRKVRGYEHSAHISPLQKQFIVWSKKEINEWGKFDWKWSKEFGSPKDFATQVCYRMENRRKKKKREWEKRQRLGERKLCCWAWIIITINCLASIIWRQVM